MPKTKAKKTRPRPKRVTTPRASRRSSSSNGKRSSHRRPIQPACIMEDGQITHMIVPIREYESLIKAGMVRDAVDQINSGDNDFVDADQLGLELAGERIARARKSKGLTQIQLSRKLKLPQSQISRIERNPDHTTVRTLKRMARALGVDVSALL